MNTTKKLTGGPAYPTLKKVWGSDASITDKEGLTYRDYVAIEAMKALIQVHGDVNRITDNDGWVSLHYRAYEHADLMLEQRMKD